MVMSRFLFVVPPIAERVRPAAVIARGLADRGHQVTWAGNVDGCTTEPIDATAGYRVSGLSSPAGQLQLWDDVLLPLARATAPMVRAAVEALRPDVVVADQHALAGAAVAHAAGLPWATLVPTSAGLVDPLGDLPAIARHVRYRTHGFLREVGLDDMTAVAFDPRISPHLVIACTTEALAGPVDDPAGRHVFVGPCLDPPPAAPATDNADDAGRPPLVVVSIETRQPHARARLLRIAATALATLDVQAVTLSSLPAGPADAVVCDGGYGPVCAALRHGTPLVTLPVVGEQPIVALQVAQAGAGLRIPVSQQAPDRLRDAVAAVVAGTAFRDGARRVRDSFAAATSATAADRLERLTSEASLSARGGWPAGR
jgi:UDP:flavonoid glycosyltransferase YjiC (YdhE family)